MIIFYHVFQETGLRLAIITVAHQVTTVVTTEINNMAEMCSRTRKVDGFKHIFC